MRKVIVILAILCAAGPLGVQAQSAFDSVPGLSSLNLGEVKLNPYVEVGFSHIGCNISIPIASDTPLPGADLRIGTLDLALSDFNVWTGTVGLNAILTPKVVVFGTATGFAPRLFGLRGEIPVTLGPIGTDANIEFTMSHLEYWSVGFGLAYGIGQGVSLLGGLTWDRTGVEITDPRRGSVPLANQTLRASAQLKTWIPYFVLQMVQPHYNASILYSPFAYGSGDIAIRSNQTRPVELLWTLRQPGQFLAFAWEYNLPLPPPMVVSLSLDAAWAKLEGASDLEFSTRTLSRDRDVTAGVYKYVLGGGLKVAVIF
jgi:hypothetical protein